MKHPTINEQNIQDYLDRFFDSDTTNAEEQALYHYFEQPHLPEELEAYREMFAYFANGLRADQPAPSPTPGTRLLRWQRYVAAVAACILLLTSVLWGIGTYHTQQLYAQYEGSFRIENGEKITDIRVLLPYIKQSEAEARRLLEAGEHMADYRQSERERLYTELSQGIDDPELQAEINRMLQP